MGSNSSKGKTYQDTSKYGQIYLQTDKTAYYAGETVTGTISLNMISNYPGNQLFLKFKGKEVVHMVRSEQRGDDQENVKYSEKNEIMKQSILVHSWDDSLPPGQFSVPFSFLLPPHLPPSFYQQGYRYFVFLEYKLEAFLQPNQETDPKMKYKQLINLRETILPVSGDLPSNVTTSLKTCGCCKQGSNTLKVNFEKNFYSPGENARVSMELDNSASKLKNLKVVFSLKQKLELRAQGKYMNFDLVKVKQELPGIVKGSNHNAESLNIVLPRFPAETDFIRETDKKKPSTSTLLRLKENKEVITSTTKSSLITSTFYLEVSCPMNGCCATLPLAKCPIGIFSPEFQLPVVTAPSKWQPVALDNVTLAFPSEQNQPLLQEYNNAPATEGQKMLNNNEFKVEMAQTSMPNHQEYNQNYFQNSHK